MESIRETFDSIPDDVIEIDLRKRSEYFEENDNMDAMLEDLWNDTADEESEDAE